MQVGSIPNSFGGRPATALSAVLRISWPSYRQAIVPSSRRTKRGALSWYFFGTLPSNIWAGSITWSSTLTRIRSSTFIVRLLLPPRFTQGAARRSTHQVEHQSLAEFRFLGPCRVCLQSVGPGGGSARRRLGLRGADEPREQALSPAVGLGPPRQPRHNLRDGRVHGDTDPVQNFGNHGQRGILDGGERDFFRLPVG